MILSSVYNKVISPFHSLFFTKFAKFHENKTLQTISKYTVIQESFDPAHDQIHVKMYDELSDELSSGVRCNFFG